MLLWRLSRHRPTRIVLLPLQNMLECFVAPLPGFYSFAMSRPDFVARSCPSVLALRVEDFLGQRYCRITVQTLEAIASMINSLGKSCLSQCLIGEFRPNVGSEVIPPI